MAKCCAVDIKCPLQACVGILGRCETLRKVEPIEESKSLEVGSEEC